TASDAVSPYYKITSGELATGQSITAITLTGEGIEAKTYSITITEGSVAIGENTANYNITLQPGTLTITTSSAEIVVKPSDGEKIYDGTALTKTEHDDFTVTGVPEGFTWTAKADGTVTNVTPGTGEKAVNAVTEFKIFDADNKDVTDQFSNINKSATGTLKINPKPVTVTTGSANKAYDGKPLTKDDAKIEGIVEGETVKVTATGSQTEVGKSENTYKIEWVTAKEANYTISDTLGELEVKDWEAEKTTPDVTSNYKLGEKIPFTIKVTNTSDIEMKGVIVEDTNAVLVAGTGYTVTDNKATVDIPANGTVEIKAEHVVTSEDILAGTVGNKATVTYGDSEKEVETKTDKLGEVDTTLTVVKKITNKPADGEAFKLGETIEYTITAKNDGNVPYENVVIKDDLTGASKTVAKLGVGESAELKTSYVVTSDDILAGSVKNKATADADPVDPEDPDSPKPHGEDEVETGDKEDPDNPPPIEEPNPSLDVVKRVTSKAANGDAYVLDEEVTYTITVKNDGNLPITNVKVKDDLTGLDETIDKLEPGDTKTFNTTYTVTKDDVEAGSVKNVATADGENKSDKPTDPGEDEVEVKTGENEEELPPYVPSHVNIHVYKVWKNDGDVAAETRPASVTVVLLKNGKPVAKKQLNEENHWHCEWHRENDGFYEDYSVEELPVEGYVTTIKWKIDGNNPNGGRIYTVTNTITNLIDDHVAYSVGYPDGTVGPNRNITRAEVATIFFRLLTDEARDRYWSQTNPYTDVMPEAWYNNAISTLSNMGILNGYADGTFRPNNPITRAELTKIASSFFGTADLSDKVSSFTDVSSDAWYSSFIKAAEDLGLVNGYGDGTFLPDNYITRAETFAIVNRTLKRAPHKDHLLPGYMNVFPDNMDTSAWYFADVQEATNSHDYKWVTEGTKTVEEWTAKLPERDWTA
ncbi:MAG: S-layer homology domain-containing protein, partial [Lachnospiraceae bacterium]|nr:S-layer homology domain-containing protein [Lachnospiraceae bacterium]